MEELKTAPMDYAKIAECAWHFPDYYKNTTKDLFDPSFLVLSDYAAPVMSELNAAYLTADDPEAFVKEAAAGTIAGFEAHWATMKGMKKKDATVNEKITLALFVLPALRKMNLAVSEPFAAELQKQWVEKYPNNPFYLGSYDDISGGFNKRFLGMCFITTAVCEFSGKPDDCEELTAFRDFRDNWLRNQPDGEALIREYYNIAPAIVNCIDYCSDRASEYDAIRTEYLEQCYRDIRSGNLQDCKDRYVKMVRSLEAKYLS